MADGSRAPVLKSPVRLNAWVYAPQDGTLSSNGETQRLEPRVAQLLDYFIAHSGRLVTRDDVLRHIWQGTPVVEDVFQRCLSRLRVALGDDPKSPVYIETIPKRGYRFLIMPQPVDGPITAPPAPAPLPVPLASRRVPYAVAGLLACLVAGVVLFWGLEKSAAMRSAETAAFEHLMAGREDRDDAEARVATLRSALTHAPDDSALQAELALALAQAQAGRRPNPEVLRQIVNAANASGTDALSHLARGQALALQGQYDKAMAQVANVSKSSALSPAARLAEAQYLTATGRDLEALDRLYPLHDRPQAEYESVLLTADIYLRLGYVEKAVLLYRRALGQAPVSDRAAAGLAETAVAQGNLGGAFAPCEDILRRLNEAPHCRFVTANTALLLGQADRARSHLMTLRDNDQFADYAAVRLAHLDGTTPPALVHGAEARYAMATQALAGEAETALAQARASGWRKWWWDRADPAFAPYREQPFFKAHLKVQRGKDGVVPS